MIMLEINPQEIRRMLMRNNCTFPAVSKNPPTVVKNGPSQAGQRKVAASNLAKARAWIEKQSGSEFTHPMLSKATGLSRAQAKHIVWSLHFKKEIQLQPRKEFENHQTPRRYVKA